MVVNNIGAFNFVNATTYDYHITSGSNLLLNKGTNPGLLSGYSLSPSMEYNHPKAAVSRCVNGILDIGAHELCAGNGIQNETVTKNLVYPNPATNTITIEGIPQSNYSITIYNMEGKSMFSIDNAKVIDISNLPSGIYLLQCTDPNHQTTTKFLKR